MIKIFNLQRVHIDVTGSVYPLKKSLYNLNNCIQFIVSFHFLFSNHKLRLQVIKDEDVTRKNAEDQYALVDQKSPIWGRFFHFATLVSLITIGLKYGFKYKMQTLCILTGMMVAKFCSTFFMHKGRDIEKMGKKPLLDREAAFNLGSWYYNKTPKDYNEANRWLLQAKKQGHLRFENDGMDCVNSAAEILRCGETYIDEILSESPHSIKEKSTIDNKEKLKKAEKMLKYVVEKFGEPEDEIRAFGNLIVLAGYYRDHAKETQTTQNSFKTEELYKYVINHINEEIFDEVTTFCEQLEDLATCYENGNKEKQILENSFKAKEIRRFVEDYGNLLS